MLFGKTVTIYSEIYTYKQIHCVGRMYSLYSTGNILRLRYKDQPVNAVLGKIHYLL
jgi:hypothetical protein